MLLNDPGKRFSPIWQSLLHIKETEVEQELVMGGEREQELVMGGDREQELVMGRESIQDMVTGRLWRRYWNRINPRHLTKVDIINIFTRGLNYRPSPCYLPSSVKSTPSKPHTSCDNTKQ